MLESCTVLYCPVPLGDVIAVMDSMVTQARTFPPAWFHFLPARLTWMCRCRASSLC